MVGPDLNTICNGHMKKEFLRYLPDVLMACKETVKSGSITMKLKIEPEIIDNGGTVTVGYKFSSKVRASMPSSQGVELYGFEDGELVSSDMTMPLPLQGEEAGE